MKYIDMDGRNRPESKSTDIDEIMDESCGIIPKDDIKLGADGALSPKLKMMLERYGTEKSDEYTSLSQTSPSLPSPKIAMSSSVASPPPPPPSAMRNGTSPPSFTPGTASIISHVPPPPSQANETKPPLDLDLANAIATVRLRRASQTSNENKVDSPATLSSPGNMGAMMSDLNKKFLARKKAAEASVVQLPGNRVATTPKFNAKMNEMFGTPPATPSSPFRTTTIPHTPTWKGSNEPSSTTWRSTSTSEPTMSPVDMSCLKEELIGVIQQEVRAAKEDIIKNEVRAAKEDIIKTIREEFQTIKEWIPQQLKDQYQLDEGNGLYATEEPKISSSHNLE